MVGVLLLLSMQTDGQFEQGMGSWVSQFVLGNSTHVILTFLLLAVRRDVLHATKGHAFIVAFGSLAVLAGTYFTFWSINHYLHPFYTNLTLAALLTFATHHTISQAKGIWSLYHLRASSKNLPRASVLERRLQSMFVPLALALVMTKWIYVPITRDSGYAFVPGMVAQLPFDATYVFLVVWILFALTLMIELFRAEVINIAKTSYLFVHCSVVGVSLVWPLCGLMMSAGIHGLEYYFLVARMLEPTPSESKKKLTKRWVWPVMILSMLPLAAIGLPRAPFAAGWFEHGQLFPSDGFLLNAVVVSHYFADEFIYRFKVPEIREVALARLRFN